MNKKQWYEELFENFAEKYQKELFTKGTEGEVDFIEQEINFDKSVKILDVGCGTGRHSILLASRGYNVTGLDLSDSMLAKARKTAEEENLQIEFLKKDARDFNFNETYDLAIMLCEGSFPLMETDEMNYSILQNIALSLKKGGKLIFTTLNGLFPLFHSVKDFINKNANDGSSSGNDTFDLMTFRNYSVYETHDDSGNPLKLECNERYYVPCEITWLLKSLGYTEIGISGAKIGDYSRKNTLTVDDYEMLVVAEKNKQ